MRLFCLFGIFVSYGCLDCNNFKDLYSMQVNMNESTIKPETLIGRIISNLDDSIKVCNNFPIITTLSNLYPPSPPISLECMSNVYCNIPVDPKNIEKLNISSQNPYIIPCETWNGKLCESANEFMNFHNCTNINVCNKCCVQSKSAEFKVHIFLLGTLVPVFLGIIAFVRLFFLIHSGNIKWNSPNSRTRVLSLPHFKDFFNISLALNMYRKPQNNESILTGSNRRKKSVPRSRGDIKKIYQ